MGVMMSQANGDGGTVMRNHPVYRIYARVLLVVGILLLILVVRLLAG
jgi:hypothetical protein